MTEENKPNYITTTGSVLLPPGFPSPRNAYVVQNTPSRRIVFQACIRSFRGHTHTHTHRGISA